MVWKLLDRERSGEVMFGVNGGGGGGGDTLSD